ncbi:hypothetical protein BGX27_002040 [Mortierella sp. AM989]|nr:hypothetical protein BGX27_002040 [Mortierella sp. AM989]
MSNSDTEETEDSVQLVREPMGSTLSDKLQERDCKATKQNLYGDGSQRGNGRAAT